MSEFTNGDGSEYQDSRMKEWEKSVRLRSTDPMDAESDPAVVEFPLGSGNEVPR